MIAHIQELRKGIDSQMFSLAHIRKTVEEILDKMYSRRDIFEHMSATDFFYPMVVNVAYLSRNHNDPWILNHLTSIISKRFMSMDSLPHTRRTFMPYAASALNPDFITVMQEDEMKILSSMELGDLALGNAGLFRKYYKSHIENYVTQGRKYYYHAMKKSESPENILHFGKLQRNFRTYANDLDTIASRFIWNGPTQHILRNIKLL
jgi:hypothetical protein